MKAKNRKFDIKRKPEKSGLWDFISRSSFTFLDTRCTAPSYWTDLGRSSLPCFFPPK